MQSLHKQGHERKVPLYWARPMFVRRISIAGYNPVTVHPSVGTRPCPRLSKPPAASAGPFWGSGLDNGSGPGTAWGALTGLGGGAGRPGYPPP